MARGKPVVGPNAGVAGVPHGDAAAVWLPLDALCPNPKNPRVHRDEITRLARTILRTAWGAPIVAQWRASGRHRVIAGHGRLLAAREILAGVEVDGELRGGAEHLFDASAPGPGLLPVRIVRVSDAEADAMTLADNARAIQGEDDAALVAEMAAQFGRDAAVMADIGFDGAALDALIKGAGDAILGANDRDTHGDPTERGASQGEDVGAEELPPDAPVFSRAGDVYDLGPHRLTCGDGASASAAGAVLVLDPPFDSPGYYSAATGDALAVLAFHGFALPDEMLRAFAAWPVRYQFVWDGVSSWWTPNRPLARHKACTVLLRDPRWLVDASLIPGDPGPPRVVSNSRGSYEYEPIAPDRVRLSTVFSAATSREDGGHAHSKPERWVAALLAGAGAARVVDPFCGSGTSLVAASRIGAAVTAHEISPRNCDVIRRRWAKYARSAGLDPGAGALD
jgi:hypothetical protein